MTFTSLFQPSRLFFSVFVLFSCSTMAFSQPIATPKPLASDVMKVVPVSLFEPLPIQYKEVGIDTMDSSGNKVEKKFVVPSPTDEKDIKVYEAFDTNEIIELTTGNDYPWAKNLRFDRLTLDDKDQPQKAVWCLEFQFKPIRMIEVEIPNKQGQLEKKLVWYMVYTVTNRKWKPEDEQILQKLREPVTQEDLQNLDLAVRLGSGLSSEPVENGKFVIKTENVPITFLPQFVIASTQENIENAAKIGYSDQWIPVALGPILRRENLEQNFETTVSMMDKTIQPGETVQGVAMWTDVDPKLNYFSVFISGLSNAYRWSNPEGVYKKGDAPGTGREMTRKTLKLNFWRPGDAMNLSEKDIRYGFPIPQSVGVHNKAPKGGGQKNGEAPVDYEWVYR